MTIQIPTYQILIALSYCELSTLKNVFFTTLILFIRRSITYYYNSQIQIFFELCLEEVLKLT